MKKIISILTVLIISIFISTPVVYADLPNDPPNGQGGGDQPIGGGAPIGGGSLILLGMAVAYGGRKLYILNKEELED